MLFGLNSANLPVDGQTLQRTYHVPGEGVPPPDGSATEPGILPIDSIRPPAAEVVSGSLDSALTQYWGSLPAGSLVTLWHEANDPNEGQDAPMILAMHRHAVTVAGAVPNVHYGAIVGAFPLWHLGQQLSAWAPPTVEWLGVDGYAMSWDNPAATPELIFGPFTTQAGMLSGDIKLLVTETNVDTALEARQEAWLLAVQQYAQQAGYVGFNGWANTAHAPNIPAIPAAVCALLAQACTAAAITAETPIAWAPKRDRSGRA